MRRLPLVLLAALPLAAFVFYYRAKALPEPVNEPAAIDAIVQQALQTWRVPGAAIVVVRDNQIFHLKGYGVREHGKTDPVTADTLFPLASCTKAFTTTAMGMLVDEGKMHWDDPVRKHIDFFQLSDPSANALVTMRDLVSHRTGVANNDLLWYRAPWSREEAIHKIGRVKLKKPFRTALQYQSTMFTAAGYAVEKAAGMPWESFVQKRIFDPLGMTRADFTTTAALQDADHASPHRLNANEQAEVMPWYSIEQPEAAGSINACARSLGPWVRFQLGDGSFDGKRLVSAENLNETHMPHTIIRMEGAARDMNPDTVQMSYGLAWVIQDHRGQRVISHAGAIDGFRAHITLLPDAKTGFAILNNLDGTSMNLAVSNALVDLLLGLPRKDWNAYLCEQVRKKDVARQVAIRDLETKRHPGTSPSRSLDAYAGIYEDPAYGNVEVFLNQGQLHWKWSVFNGPLMHYHFDTFLLMNDRIGYPKVVFTLGSDGEVTAMHVADPMDINFKKQKPSNSR